MRQIFKLMVKDAPHISKDAPAKKYFYKRCANFSIYYEKDAPNCDGSKDAPIKFMLNFFSLGIVLYLCFWMWEALLASSMSPENFWYF